MSSRYNFHLESVEARRALPQKIIIGKEQIETMVHVTLKLFGFLLFYRERLQIGINLHSPNIPFVPDLVQLDYEMRPKLWVECGECSVQRLNKLAVKVPEAEIWILKESKRSAEELLTAMAREQLRRDRYRIVGLDETMVEEVCGLMKSRNEIFWVRGEFDPPSLKFTFNGLWFDVSFELLAY